MMHVVANGQIFLTKNFVFKKRDDVTGEWRRLHNKELYALY
jgi:hypothetical protein